MLRTSLCKNQTSWEMKIFKPPSNFAYSQALRGGAQKCPFKRLQHSCFHGNNGCFFEAWGLIFIQKRRKKRMKCLFLYLRLNPILQIRLHFDEFYFPLTSCDFYSQILSVYERSIEVFLFFFCCFFCFGCFYFKKRKPANLSKNVHFSSSLG